MDSSAPKADSTPDQQSSTPAESSAAASTNSQVPSNSSAPNAEPTPVPATQSPDQPASPEATNKPAEPAPAVPAPVIPPVSTPSPQTPPLPSQPAPPAQLYTPQPPAGSAAPKAKSSLPIKAIVTAVIIVLVIAAVGFAAFAFLSPKNKPAAVLPSVKVGVMMAFTGGSSSMGYGEMKGIQLAQKQLGADNIELVQMDSQCDPTVAPQAMQRLVNQHVVAVIGDGCSSASTAALPIADANKIPMISPSASSPTLSIPNDYFFRVVPPDTYQGAYLAKAVYARGIKTVGIFYTNEPYGINMNSVFTKEFQTLGGKVLTSVNATSGVINLGTQIAAIKAAKPQGVVFVSNSVTTGAAAMQLARTAGITAPFFGGDGLYDQTLISSAQSAAQGLIITTFPTGTAAFKQLLYTNDQGEQLYAAAEAYDAFDALYLAIKHGATTGPEIKAELPNISFNGVSANIKFDANGDEEGANYQYALLQVKDGSFVSAQ